MTRRATSGRPSVWDAKMAAAVADGTAVTAEGYAARVEVVKSGGKCWSVDEQRAAMGDLKA